MKHLKTLLFVGAILSGFFLFAAFPAQSVFSSKAVLAQRVLPSEEAALFGDAGDLLDSEPKLYIISDAAAFLEEESEAGHKLIDQAYLEANGIYPLQLQTVLFTLGQIKLGSGITLMLMLTGLWLVRRKGPPLASAKAA
jgi:hypothetical protein